jgi:hypothetical protein
VEFVNIRVRHKSDHPVKLHQRYEK